MSKLKINLEKIKEIKLIKNDPDISDTSERYHGLFFLIPKDEYNLTRHGRERKCHIWSDSINNTLCKRFTHYPDRKEMYNIYDVFILEREHIKENICVNCLELEQQICNALLNYRDPAFSNPILNLIRRKK